MSQPEKFKRRKRTRVGGPSQQGRLLGAVVFLSALLLAAMVLTASLDLPPPAPPAATPPTATPDRAAAAPRLYLVGTHIEPAASVPRLVALDLATGQPVYSLDNVRNAALSADGRRLYALETNRVTALATATKQTLWRLDLPPLAATANQPPTLLALTPDQKILLIYRQELDFAANTARAWIEQVDVGTHQPNARNISIAAPHWVETIEIAADGHTLFMVGNSVISVLDLRDGTQKQLVAAPSGGLGAALSADRLRLFVVDREGWITEYDTLSQRLIHRVRLQDPELAPVGGSASLALAPHSDRLALLVSQRGSRTIVRGELVEETSGQALIVVSLDDGTLVRRSARVRYAQPLAWSGDSEQIYFFEFGAVYRWQIDADRVDIEQSLGSDATITRLLLGPALPVDVPPATPTPAAGPPQPTAIPAAAPTPLVQPDLAPLAWLWPLNGDRQSVVAFSRDGSVRTVADHVLHIIPRPQQPPLLLRAPDPSHWALFDPTTGLSTALDLAAPPRLSFGAPTFLHSPDGRGPAGWLAFVTTHDPNPADDLRADRQLVTVDTATGAVTVVIDAGRWDQIVFGQLLEWADDGIYLSSTLATVSIAEDPRAIWRIDPDAAAPEPELLLAVGERGANFQLNAAAGLLLYEPYPDDLSASSLRLRDLRTGSEQILLENGPFISRNAMQIAPDGRFVAFLRPGRVEREVVLSLYNVQTQLIQHLYSGPYLSWPYALRWSSGGALLHLRTSQDGFPQGLEQELVWDLSGIGSSLDGPMRWTLPPGGVAPPPEQPGVELVSAERSLSLAFFQDHALLQEYGAQSAQQPLVSIPLPSPWGPTSGPLQLRRDTRIVYAP